MIIGIVLAQAHRDPLFRINKLRKLECFSEKRFKELQDIIRGFTLALVKQPAPFYQDEISQGVRRVIRRDRLSYVGKGDGFSHIVSRRRQLWWESKDWDLVADIENPWGDLSMEGEYLLKVLLKGRL